MIANYEQYPAIKAAFEMLLSLLKRHELLNQICNGGQDITHPSTFRAGEYGVWVEMVFDVLCDWEISIPSEILLQIRNLGKLMSYDESGSQNDAASGEERRGRSR